MHPLFLLLPAAICAAAALYFVAEAETEARTLRSRLNPSRREMATAIGLAVTCLAATVVAMGPVILFAVDTAIAGGLAR